MGTDGGATKQDGSRELATCVVGWVRADHVDLERLPAWLPVDELRRTAHLTDEDRRRSLAAAVVARLLVGQLRGCRPGEVTIARTCASCHREHGRPRLPEGDLSLSLSHSGFWALAAIVSSPLEVGIDVEARPRAWRELADEVCAPDESANSDLDIQQLWTRKEALLKATGDGIRVPPRSIRVLANAVVHPRLGHVQAHIHTWHLDYAVASLVLLHPQERPPRIGHVLVDAGTWRAEPFSPPTTRS